MKRFVTLAMFSLAALGLVGPSIFARPEAGRMLPNEAELKSLAARSSLIVSARLLSKPERSNIVISASYVIWMLRLRSSLVFKGARPSPLSLFAEFDTSSLRTCGRHFDPGPPSRLGSSYLVFLVDRSPNLPRWKVIGMKPYSKALALRLRRVQAARVHQASSVRSCME